MLFFPISYVFGDVLTEVYGYARSRRVIWAGFAGLAFASFMAYVVVALPPAPFWKNQAAYEVAFGQAWRIALASMIAYFCGEFVNSFMLAKMKILTEGRWLWTRTIGSTIVGEGVDSLLFYPLAFYGTGHHPRREAAHGDARRSSSRRSASRWSSRRSPTRSWAGSSAPSTRTTTTATRTSRRFP